MPVFDIPFVYQAKVVPQGKRKSVDRSFASSVLVEIPSVAADEAPLMLRWHRQSWGGNDWTHPPHDYRQFDDALFKPVFYEYSGRPDHHVSLDEAIAAVPQGYRSRMNPLFAGTEAAHVPAEMRMRAEDLAGFAVRSTDEAEVAAKIRALASDLVAVDGLLFRRAHGGEPIYDLSRGYVDIKELDRTKPEDRDIRTHFRADQIAEVLEFRRLVDPEDFAEAAEIDLDDPATYRMHLGQFIEVFDASCLRYRADQGPKLLDYAGKVVASARKEIGDAPVEAMIAYARLRDGMKAGVGAPEACGLLEAYADTLPDGNGMHAYFGGGDRDQIIRETGIYRMSPTPETEPPSLEGPRP